MRHLATFTPRGRGDRDAVFPAAPTARVRAHQRRRPPQPCQGAVRPALASTAARLGRGRAVPRAGGWLANQMWVLTS